MDEFNNFNENNKEDSVNGPELETDSFEFGETEQDNIPNEPMLNPISFTPVKPIRDKKPINKGIAVFALIMAFVIAISGALAVGYYIGQTDFDNDFGLNVDIDFDLSAKPKDTDQLTEAEIYEEVNPSIVGIVVYNQDGSASQGSGIVFSDDGYIITNDHIYAEIVAPKFKIFTYDGKEYDAKFVAGDVISDLAVLKVENAELAPATFGDSDELYSGEHVVAIGRPKDATIDSSITSGIISAVNRRITSTSSYSARVIQTDTAINPGSSGGALVNMYGQVIGVTSAKMASSDYEGTGYAIPTTVVRRIVSELISQGEITTRAKLGITYNMIDSITTEISDYKYVGIRIAEIDGSSGLYGKAQAGDTITHINGIAITKDEIVLDVIENCRAGETITVTIVSSDGMSRNVEVKLSANKSASSYKLAADEESSQSSGGSFNFPFGD